MDQSTPVSSLFVAPYHGPIPMYRESDGTESVDTEEIAYMNTHYLARVIVHYCAEIKHQGGDWDYDGVMSMIWRDVRRLTGQDADRDHRFTDDGMMTGPRSRERMIARQPVSRRNAYIVFSRDDFKCVHCGSGDDLEVDHIHPVSHGGTNSLENLQTLCKPCNMRKGAKLPEELGDDW